jgi:hypothetical protein
VIASGATESSDRGSSLVAVSRCDICGKEFDPLVFQIVVPGLPGSFDRIDCALQARDLVQAQPLRELGPAAGEAGRVPVPHIRAVV